MAKVVVHAGNFVKGEYSVLSSGAFLLKVDRYSRSASKMIRESETVSFSSFEVVEAASEESVKKVGGTVGWGAAGLVAFGPVGLLAGLLLGGKSKNVTFVAQLKDGRKLFGVTDSATYTQLLSAVF
jgi:hypothetical protein